MAIKIILKRKLTEQRIKDRAVAAQRQLERARAYQAGDVSLRRVYVNAHYVPRYHVSGHYRYVPTARPKKTATKAGLRVIQGGAS